MAVSKSSTVPPPATADLLTPLLPALTAAAVSKEPATAVLPLLSPILRQRVKYLAPTSVDPWLRLLCYDTARAAKLSEVVQAGAAGGPLEPHPVSGEVEIDWDYDAETRFRRLDTETLQALVVLRELGLTFLLVYCVGDAEGQGGPDGWRVGEVSVVSSAQAPFASFGESKSLRQAEEDFTSGKTTNPSSATESATQAAASSGSKDDGHDADDDDDDYWARYDATPSRTPAQKPSPAPQSSGGPVRASSNGTQAARRDDDDDDDAEYFAQYDHVQPAMDNHDPDEEAAAAQVYAPPLGLAPHEQQQQQQRSLTNGSHDARSPPGGVALADVHSDRDRIAQGLLHPRPESSASSNGSQTVARLEEEAGRQETNEFGVKQHISRSVRSLFQLSRASGIDREEFERIVKRELDLLGIMGDIQ